MCLLHAFFTHCPISSPAAMSVSASTGDSGQPRLTGLCQVGVTSHSHLRLTSHSQVGVTGHIGISRLYYRKSSPYPVTLHVSPATHCPASAPVNQTSC